MASEAGNLQNAQFVDELDLSCRFYFLQMFRNCDLVFCFYISNIYMIYMIGLAIDRLYVFISLLLYTIVTCFATVVIVENQFVVLFKFVSN